MIGLDDLHIDGLIYLGEALYGLPGYDKRASARVISRAGMPPSTTEWLIMTIKVQPSRRGRGLGGRLLQAICTAADKQGCTTRLFVEKLTPPGLEVNQLSDWYKRHGFQYVKPNAPYEMVRYPRGTHE